MSSVFSTTIRFHNSRRSNFEETLLVFRHCILPSNFFKVNDSTAVCSLVKVLEKTVHLTAFQFWVRKCSFIEYTMEEATHKDHISTIRTSISSVEPLESFQFL